MNWYSSTDNISTRLTRIMISFSLSCSTRTIPRGDKVSVASILLQCRKLGIEHRPHLNFINCENMTSMDGWKGFPCTKLTITYVQESTIKKYSKNYSLVHYYSGKFNMTMYIHATLEAP